MSKKSGFKIYSMLHKFNKGSRKKSYFLVARPLRRGGWLKAEPLSNKNFFNATKWVKALVTRPLKNYFFFWLPCYEKQDCGSGRRLDKNRIRIRLFEQKKPDPKKSIILNRRKGLFLCFVKVTFSSEAKIYIHSHDNKDQEK